METPDDQLKKIATAQEIVRRYVPDDKSLVDELMAERRDDEMAANGSGGE